MVRTVTECRVLSGNPTDFPSVAFSLDMTLPRRSATTLDTSTSRTRRALDCREST